MGLAGEWECLSVHKAFTGQWRHCSLPVMHSAQGLGNQKKGSMAGQKCTLEVIQGVFVIWPLKPKRWWCWPKMAGASQHWHLPYAHVSLWHLIWLALTWHFGWEVCMPCAWEGCPCWGLKACQTLSLLVNAYVVAFAHWQHVMKSPCCHNHPEARKEK